MRGRRAAAIAVVSLAALAVARGAGGGPALYDGICAPVSYTSLGASPGPLSTAKPVMVDQPAEVNTQEATPQAQIILPPNSFPLPAGTAVTITIKPIPPPAARPGDGAVVGNVYQITATRSDGSGVDLAPGKPATVALEVTAAGGPQLAMEHFDGVRWNRLTTVQAGCGTVEEANTSRLGAFALVVLGGSSGPPSTTLEAGFPWAVVLLVLGTVVLVALSIATIRARRRGNDRRISQPRRPH